MEGTAVKNNRKWLIIGGAALAVIVIALVLVLWVFKGDDDITFGLRASFTMEEAIDAMKKKGYELDEKASYTHEDGEAKAAFSKNIKLYGIEASRVTLWKYPNQGLSVGYDFADYENAMDGDYRVLKDAWSLHKKVYEVLLEKFGTPLDGDREYKPDERRRWKKEGIEYEFSDLYSNRDGGNLFYLEFSLR